jgi:hypothetical protein
MPPVYEESRISSDLSDQATPDQDLLDFARSMFWDDPQFQERYVAVIETVEGYFDLSQRNTKSVVVMAGYVSTVSNWVEFSEKWTRTIRKAGIPCFHMTDFVARVPPFDHLSESERGRLMRRLVRLINKYALASFDMAIHKPDFEKVFGKHRKAVPTPWTYLSLMVLGGVRKWSLMSGRTKPIPYIFDRGDRYSDEFKKGFDKVIAVSPNYANHMLIGDFVLADRCKRIPLQAADVLAWETWRYRCSTLTQENPVLRKSYEALLKTPKFSVLANEEFLAKHVRLDSEPENIWESTD